MEMQNLSCAIKMDVDLFSTEIGYFLANPDNSIQLRGNLEMKRGLGCPRPDLVPQLNKTVWRQSKQNSQSKSL